MMTMTMAIQTLLTVTVTGIFILLAMNFVQFTKDNFKIQKWFEYTVRILFVLHLFAFPAAIINVIWSF